MANTSPPRSEFNSKSSAHHSPPRSAFAQQFTVELNSEQLACLFQRLSQEPSKCHNSVNIAAQSGLTLCKGRGQLKLVVGTVESDDGLNQSTAEINKIITNLNALSLKFTQESVIIFPNVTLTDIAFMAYWTVRLFCNVEILAQYGNTGLGSVYVIQVRNEDLFFTKQILDADGDSTIEKIPCAKVCKPKCEDTHHNCRRKPSDCIFKYPCCNACKNKDCKGAKCDKEEEKDKKKKRKDDDSRDSDASEESGEKKKDKKKRKHEHSNDSESSESSESSDESVNKKKDKKKKRQPDHSHKHSNDSESSDESDNDCGCGNNKGDN